MKVQSRMQLLMSGKFLISLLFVLSLSSLTSGCRDSATGIHSSPSDLSSGGGLAIVGYNYTERGIGQFFVDGTGAGNIHVSSAYSGGGGTVCCADISSVDHPEKIAIKWQSGGCNYNTTKDPSGQLLYETHYFFKEAMVELPKPIPARPNVLEVHFYPDGHVEVAITEDSSPPRLRLDERRANRKPYAQCPNDKRPEN